MKDNGDGTVTFTGAGVSITEQGSFPDGPVRVVFYDHNYTPDKDGLEFMHKIPYIPATVVVEGDRVEAVWIGMLDQAAREELQVAIGAAAGGLFALNQARAHHTDTHFEDASDHKIVYQCNKADDDYIRGILFSVGELIRKHGDNVEIVVACFGPGIHPRWRFAAGAISIPPWRSVRQRVIRPSSTVLTAERSQKDAKRI